MQISGTLSMKYPDISKKLTPHVRIRGYRVYIQGSCQFDINADITTTDIYARADTESKRKALESVYPGITPAASLPDWNRDLNLLDYLNGL